MSKSPLAVLLLLLSLPPSVSSADSPPGYTFSISASSTDPWENTALPTGGIRDLFLWLVCGDDGLAAFEARLTGDVAAISFTPDAGVMNIGSSAALQLAVPGCPSTDPLVLGHWTVFDTTGINACLSPTLDGERSIAAISCATEKTLMPRCIGFASDNSTPRELGQWPCLEAPGPMEGLVLGFESVLAPPYEFTSLASGVLLLNGLQYYPQPRDEIPAPTYDIPQSERDAVAVRQALRDSVVAIVREIEPLSARVLAAATLFESSTLIDSARVNPGGGTLMLYETGRPPQLLDIFRDRPPSKDRSDENDDWTGVHSALEHEFFTVINAGGTVAFGDSYFALFSHTDVTRKTRALLRSPRKASGYEGTALRSRDIRAAFERKGALR